MRRSAWLFTALALLRVQLQPASACVKIENEEERLTSYGASVAACGVSGLFCKLEDRKLGGAWDF